MLLELSSVPNPDFGETEAPAPSKTVIVKDFAEASQACRAYIKEYALGSGNWIWQVSSSGRLMDERTHAFYRVSFNGRVWSVRSGHCVYE